MKRFKTLTLFAAVFCCLHADGQAVDFNTGTPLEQVLKVANAQTEIFRVLQYGHGPDAKPASHYGPNDVHIIKYGYGPISTWTPAAHSELLVETTFASIGVLSVLLSKVFGDESRVKIFLELLFKDSPKQPSTSLSNLQSQEWYAVGFPRYRKTLLQLQELNELIRRLAMTCMQAGQTDTTGLQALLCAKTFGKRLFQ